MSSDGAQLGVDAETAIDKIIGGKEIPEDKVMTMQQQADRIMAVDITKRPESYGDAADMAAKIIVLWLQEDPSRAQGPVENVYELDGDGNMRFDNDGRAIISEHGWYGRMKSTDYGTHIEALGLSGFQWGWAVNAARAIVELPPVPNPAIITVGREG